MPRYLILTQSKPTANALGAWLELVGERPWQFDNDPRAIIWEHQPDLDAYETLAQRIEDLTSHRDGIAPLNHVVVLVDSVNVDELSVVTEGGGWDSLIAMLILTFPEIRWVFGVCIGKGVPTVWEEAWSVHRLPSLLGDTHGDPLFDPSRLQNFVRIQTNARLEKMKDDLRLPCREHSVAVIEEEKTYAYFHGYTAYRFGFRADIVTTWARMKERFGDENKSHGYWLIMEDMSLNFADREKDVHLLYLGHGGDEEHKEKGRAHHCPQLDSAEPNVETSEYRTLITTGQSRSHDALALNRTYLHEKKHGRGRIVLKPASGLFDLWERAGLFRKHFKIGRPGNAPGYYSLLDKPTNNVLDVSGHGAPGKLLLVAEKLIERAAAMIGKVNSVNDAVQGAVLATDALELTGGRTPTTAIEALSLKHRFEILAECQFSGVENHISITRRLEEIYRETAAICRWFAPRQREHATLNARMHVLNQLVGTLREQNQFDEEQTCINRVRHIHATLWMRARPWRYLFWPPIRYVELLLTSIPTFALVLTVWVMILGLLFAWVNVDPSAAQWGMDRLAKGLESAVTSFFSVGAIRHGATSGPLSPGQVMVSGLAIVTGFLHLGILISHLYMVVSRR